INGDGYGDIIVGSTFYDGTFQDGGRVDLYLGSSSGLRTVPSWSSTGIQVNEGFAEAVANGGDYDGDGYSDMVIGAPGFSGAYPGSGRVLLYRGSSTGFSASPAWTASGAASGAGFGFSVSCAGDINGDGFEDL